MSETREHDAGDAAHTAGEGDDERRTGPYRRVLVADSVRLTSAGICELLSRRGHSARGCDARAESVRQAMAFDAPEVVVVNAATVDLAVVVETVRSKGPIPVVAMSVAHTVADVSLCAEFGLAGFILADDSADDLLALVESATETNPQCPPRAVPMLMSALRRRRLRPDTDRLTEREWDVAHLLQEGLANKEIAARLGITARTVKNHLHHVYDKLGLHSRAEVAAMLSELDRRDAASRSLA